MSLQKQIKDLIIEANKTEDLESLINLNLRLAGYLFLLSDEESKFHKGYTDAYTTRKVEEARAKINAEGSLGDRETKSIIECEELRKVCDSYEVLYTKIKADRFALSEFIGVLTQKISYLKKEKEIQMRE